MIYPQKNPKNDRHYQRYAIVNGKGLVNAEYSSFWQFAESVLKWSASKARDYRDLTFAEVNSAMVEGYHVELFYHHDRK
ncbi:hypothetical protein OGA32_000124 [Salmonella enterica]|nr:hypothetical protein [Salmonella enterica]